MDIYIECMSVPLSHLTSPSLIESANGGTITVFASPETTKFIFFVNGNQEIQSLPRI